MSNILIADDMPLCREPIAEALRRHGHHVTCAADGLEAVQKLNEARPDLLLLDVAMPEMDGLTVLGIIRRNPALKGLPVILLTERSDRQLVVQALERGIQGYILKSRFSLKQLLARIQACVGQTPDAQEAAPQQTAAQPSTPPAQATAAAATTPAGPASTATTAPASTATATAAPPHAPTRDTPAPPTTAAAPPTGTNAQPESPHTPARIPPSEKPSRAQLLADLKPVIPREKLLRLVRGGLHLKPLAATVHNVMAITGSAGCSASDVARAIASDQALCIRLLRLANSSAYSRGRPANNVQTAVQRIGLSEVRKLVMTLGVFDQYTSAESETIDIRAFWEHSLATGLIAAAVAKQCHFPAVDDCFLWGTMHDVGRVILIDHLAADYARTVETAGRLRLPLESVEPRMLTLDHCDVLKHALEHWQFPKSFVDPIASHHETLPRIEKLKPDHRRATMILVLANRIAHALVLGNSGNEIIYPFNSLLKSLDMQPDDLHAIVENVQDETRDIKLTMLAHSDNTAWPDVPAELQSRLKKPIHLLRMDPAPPTDAFDIFFDSIADRAASAPPNLGVIHIAGPGELTAAISRLQKAESDANAPPLPTIIVHDSAALDATALPDPTRPVAMLRSPVAVADLIDAVNNLIGS